MLNLRAVVYDIGPREKRRYVAIVEPSIVSEDSDFPARGAMRITSSEFTIPPVSLEEFSNSYNGPDKEELLIKIKQELSSPSKADRYLGEIGNKLQEIKTKKLSNDDMDYINISFRIPRLRLRKK